uniref:Uncharacterized protein n=1 Tax=Steinernema glaseri TaxID=37863 RepID=A0A1I8A4H4_9BILA
MSANTLFRCLDNYWSHLCSRHNGVSTTSSLVSPRLHRLCESLGSLRLLHESELVADDDALPQGSSTQRSVFLEVGT